VTLVDTNVLLDVFTNDPRWADWSIHQLDEAKLAPGRYFDFVGVKCSAR